MWTRKAIEHTTGEHKHVTLWEHSPSLEWPDSFVSYKDLSPWLYKKKKRNSINKNSLCIIQERAEKSMEYFFTYSYLLHSISCYHWNLEQICGQGPLETLSFFQPVEWCCNTTFHPGVRATRWWISAVNHPCTAGHLRHHPQDIKQNWVRTKEHRNKSVWISS